MCFVCIGFLASPSNCAISSQSHLSRDEKRRRRRVYGYGYGCGSTATATATALRLRLICRTDHPRAELASRVTYTSKCKHVTDSERPLHAAFINSYIGRWLECLATLRMQFSARALSLSHSLSLSCSLWSDFSEPCSATADSLAGPEVEVTVKSLMVFPKLPRSNSLSHQKTQKIAQHTV